MAQRRQRLFTGLGLLLALGFPALPVSRWENEFENVRHLIGYEAIWWAAVLALVLHVLFLENRPISSLAFARTTWTDILVGLVGGVITLAGLAAIFLAVFPLLHLSERHQLNQLTSTPLWWRWISVIRAAGGEEILFRGYAISRLRDLSGNPAFGVVLAWVIFTIEHVGIWGWGHLLIAGFGGAALTFLFVWRKNLWVSVIAHMIIDGGAILS